MGKVVAAVGMAYAPGTPTFARNLKTPLALGKSLAAGKPDHCNQSSTLARWACGPMDGDFAHLENTVFPGAPEIAEHVLAELVENGYDVSRAGSTEYGNNLLMPWITMNPGITCPIIPIFISVFTPPLVPCRRAYALGEAIAAAKSDPQLFVEFDDYEIEIAKKNEYLLNSPHPLVNDV
ncbi:hypothetical protein LCER1_G006311 [Lachnellula cervina]|uniref:Extradiol ring-cleavage dioxygenase class III enzyme subunit B domain-containing protein n=1 Tax=Lachnellula cervina TaxID=1316786 RepID=A0A7D8YMV5_9HELO|nr:hypothetical protein LCER1_G006311 [Lachnellula cervina]